MNRYIAAAAALIAGLLSISHADAQSFNARVVSSCGSTSPFHPPAVGSTFSLTVDANGNLCGGGGTVTLTWPGTAGNAGGAATTTGTMPYVNAYPVSPVNVTESTTATTGSFSVTLPAVAGHTNWLCGFVITSGGTTTSAVVNATVTGVVTGTNNYAYLFPSSGQGALGVALPSCIPSSAVNTAIAVSVPAGGAGTTAALTAWGYSQ